MRGAAGRPYHARMGRHLLYLPSLGVAFLGVLVFVAALVLDPVRQFAVRPVTALAAAFAGLLFLRGLFDPKVHRGTAAANRELSPAGTFLFRRRPLFDPEWGVFGSRTGGPALRLVRSIACLAFALSLFGGPLDLVWLAFWTAGVAMVLSLLHVGLAAAGPSP